MTDKEALTILKIADSELSDVGLTDDELKEYRDICKRGYKYANRRLAYREREKKFRNAMTE